MWRRLVVRLREGNGECPWTPGSHAWTPWRRRNSQRRMTHLRAYVWRRRDVLKQAGIIREATHRVMAAIGRFE